MKTRVTVHVRRPTCLSHTLCGRVATVNAALTLEAAKHHPVGENELGMVCRACAAGWKKL